MIKMAQTSWGFAGSINAIQWARFAHLLGHDYAVDGIDDLAALALSGQRSIGINPGLAFGRGVATELDATESLDLPTPPGGSGRFYLIALRRDWSAQSTGLVVIPGEITLPAVPAMPPSAYPAAREDEPGVLDDQPLHWAWVESSTTAVTLFDLRRFPRSVAGAPRLYRWNNEAEQDAELGMEPGDIGYREDEESFYRWADGWEPLLDDTGWIGVAAPNANWTFNQVAYRRKNGVVYLRGRIVTPASGSADIAFVLPPGFRPAYSGTFILWGGTSSVRAWVRTSGEFGLVSSTNGITYDLNGMAPYPAEIS